MSQRSETKPSDYNACGEGDRISVLFNRRLIATEALLTTKLYVPRAHPNLVPRPRLSELLTEGMSRKLTLISAPAGFGKTTLLSEWRMMYLDSEYPLTWVSLEEADNDPTRFLSYLITALQAIDADVGEAVLAALRSPQAPPLDSALAALINEIAAIPKDFAFVLDDYHVIANEAVHDAITFLLDHLPPQMHLVWMIFWRYGKSFSKASQVLGHLSLSHRARNSYPPAATFTSLIFFAPSLPFLGGLHDLLIS